MREVKPELLWIGNARDARETATVVGAGVEAVVDLAMEEPAAAFPREIVYCRVPLVDGAGNELSRVRLAVQTVASLIRGEIATLVACSRGMSRSPAIVAAALASLSGATMDEELERLAASGPLDVSPGLWAEICAAVESTGDGK